MEITRKIRSKMDSQDPGCVLYRRTSFAATRSVPFPAHKPVLSAMLLGISLTSIAAGFLGLGFQRRGDDMARIGPVPLDTKIQSSSSRASIHRWVSWGVFTGLQLDGDIVPAALVLENLPE